MLSQRPIDHPLLRFLSQHPLFKLKLKPKLNLIQSALPPDATILGEEARLHTQWITSCQTSEETVTSTRPGHPLTGLRATDNTSLTQSPRRRLRRPSTTKTTLFQTSVLTRTSYRLKRTLLTKRRSRSTSGLQSVTRMVFSLFQDQMTMIHTHMPPWFKQIPN